MQQILEEFYDYLGALSTKTLPKSLLGKAIGYALNQKDTFYTMLEDGNIELTNSRAERLIKMIVIGRKNFLFSNTPNGARASAMIYSIIQTANS
ncbi:MAG: transposase [Eubacteriales bacterium]